MANETKYHVNKETGRAGVCRATKKGCPLGADTPHFSSKEETNKHVENIEKLNNEAFKIVQKKHRRATIEKINSKTRKIDAEGVLKNTLGNKNLQPYEISRSVDQAIKDDPYFLNIKMDHIPEEECGVYGGYSSFSYVKNINTDSLARMISRSLVRNDGTQGAPSSFNGNGKTDKDNIEAITPIVHDLLKKHEFDKISAYELDVKSDYYEDGVFVKNFDADKLQSFTNELHSLLV